MRSMLAGVTALDAIKLRLGLALVSAAWGRAFLFCIAAPLLARLPLRFDPDKEALFVDQDLAAKADDCTGFD